MLSSALFAAPVQKLWLVDLTRSQINLGLSFAFVGLFFGFSSFKLIVKGVQ
jgi:hypothetical protein